ncbi:4-hydroxybenzoate 3-monooxygenase [Nocardia terpenica]|uniref:4-hydroxybenzoate 3-monooxygenase n=1 Tax=Nocardia terpenica TaxID=455432 RepID=A0A164LX56_9NOCA|nr:4-hydroxybenzoate 3-monooxygenase [Nocardia terpenica]KZM72832.1 4-hydroxybenzoate 3-monooxygenase [Nocardia terpenica]MBF6061260.1 4-hydroxybenzoate 3-monooxygenase [Nocardia terpenica]MBF6105511.1 4-hydroxybenzoate 3-monooxygenase [Nocardia terpenica]MBF6113019.1 4-hydroxybenzoate 3-monooxygenase [Nocardia terpenica]MBF6119149.1 4-hydroxybenzoate 3-monooxygenase [Nocardia terpenica]
MTGTRTQVAIVGAGPAGLMLSHLLSRSGIDSVVVDIRTREEIATTSRAGILEAGSVRLLVDSGVSDRVVAEGDRHDGVVLRFDGENHRIDFRDLVGESVWLYPQTEVFIDLAARRTADGGDVRYGVADTAVDITGDRPVVTFADADGRAVRVEADLLVGADGSRSICRRALPDGVRTEWFREYPFAWFGFLTDAPQSHPELIYARSEHGFALVSQRTPTMQRMYFQCSPTERVQAWDDDRIWAEMRKRVNGNGFELREGPIGARTVLPFRSFVTAPMRHGRLLLAGDAAHTVPPTGAKGLNLALADVRVLHEVITEFFARGREDVLDTYGDRALDRVWKAQHFSYWMTTMLHSAEGVSAFDRERQRAELSLVTGSRHGAAYLAEAYTGWA